MVAAVVEAAVKRAAGGNVITLVENGPVVVHVLRSVALVAVEVGPEAEIQPVPLPVRPCHQGREDVRGTAGYAWNQTDFSSYYITTNRLRYHLLNPTNLPGNPVVPVDFLLLDRPTYRVDTHTVSAGLERQWPRHSVSAGYSASWSRGENASGLGGESLPAADDKVDSVLHSLSFGVEYRLRKDITLRSALGYEYYRDRSYDALNGGRAIVTFGLSYRL